MHNIQSSALKPPSSQITCTTLSLNSKCLNYAASMCLVKLSHWYPDFGNIQQSLLTWFLILVLRGNLLIFLIGRMIFLLPFPETKSLFVANFPFLTQPWSWILCISIAFLWLMIKQKQKEKQKQNKERYTCRAYSNFIKVVLVIGLVIAEWSSVNCVLFVSRTWSSYKVYIPV